MSTSSTSTSSSSSSSSSSTSTTPNLPTKPSISEYEQLRLTKIARNEAHLKSLGLDSSLLGQTSTPKTKKTTKRKPASKNNDAIPEELKRRSGRNKGEGKVDYNERNAYALLEVAEKKLGGKEVGGGDTTNGRKQRRAASNGGDVDEFQFSENLPVLLSSSSSSSSSSSKSSSIPRQMSKDTPLNPSKIVTEMLNTPMNATGKAAVVNYISTSSPTLPPTYFTHHDGIGFNKYSGVLEFKNSVVLWVNFSDNVEAGYGNEFFEKGREMSWFGGSKMTGDSAVIKRLVKLGKEAMHGKESNILLYTRFCMGSKTSPYVCLGRVGYVSHDEGVSPVKFRWRLIDFEGLVKGRGEEKEKENLFKKFVDF